MLENRETKPALKPKSDAIGARDFAASQGTGSRDTLPRADRSPVHADRKRSWGYYVFRQGLRTLLKRDHGQAVWVNQIQCAVTEPAARRRAV